MKYTPLSKNVLKIEWTDSILDQDKLLNFIANVDYISKSDTHYRCFTHHLTPIDYSFLTNNLNLLKLVSLINRIYHTSYALTAIWEVVKMEEGDFLSPHTDRFHKLQCVLYMNSLDENDWWILSLEWLNLIPKYWDIIIFHWWTLHEVSLIKTKKSRICITFWLD